MATPKKVDYRLTSIGYLTLQDRNICPRGATLCIIVQSLLLAMKRYCDYFLKVSYLPFEAIYPLRPPVAHPQ